MSEASLVEQVEGLDNRIKKVVVNNLDVAISLLRAKHSVDIETCVFAFGVPPDIGRNWQNRKFYDALNSCTELLPGVGRCRYVTNFEQAQRLVQEADSLQSILVIREKRARGLLSDRIIKVPSLAEPDIGDVVVAVRHILTSHPRGYEVVGNVVPNFIFNGGSQYTFRANFWIGVFGTKHVRMTPELLRRLPVSVHYDARAGGYGDETSIADRIIIYCPQGFRIYDKTKIDEPVAFIENNKLFAEG